MTDSNVEEELNNGIHFASHTSNNTASSSNSTGISNNGNHRRGDRYNEQYQHARSAMSPNRQAAHGRTTPRSYTPYQSHSPNYRRQMLLNHMQLLDAVENEGHGEAYEELKRLIIFAGIFFLFIIIFVLLKFQVSLDDVFKWSPVVWLIGVIICGLLMNIFIQMKKFLKRRRAKRLQQQQDLLYSLHLPTSFPCLAPPPHTEACCRCGGGLFSSLPQRHQQQHRLRGFRDFSERHFLSSNMHADENYGFSPSEIADLLIAHSQSGAFANNLPELDEMFLTRYGFSASNSADASCSFMPRIPTYEQVVKGAKTWLLSKPICSLSSSGETTNQNCNPPAYSPVNLPIIMGNPNAIARMPFTPLRIEVDESTSQLLQPTPEEPENAMAAATQVADIPPPAYDESVSVVESACRMSPEISKLNTDLTGLLTQRSHNICPAMAHKFGFASTSYDKRAGSENGAGSLHSAAAIVSTTEDTRPSTSYHRSPRNNIVGNFSPNTNNIGELRRPIIIDSTTNCAIPQVPILESTTSFTSNTTTSP